MKHSALASELADPEKQEHYAKAGENDIVGCHVSKPIPASDRALNDVDLVLNE